jgi:tripartite-type tricarboxylate transporter receptor subunit TctC
MRKWLVVLLFLAFNVQAQTFPARPVTLLITFPAGGPTDIAGRALAEATSKYLGQQVVVENRPGATGTLGAAALVNAKPDGYLVSMIPITVLRLAHMENVAYDPMKDISYVMGVSGYVFAFIVRSDSPWKSMGDLIAAAKASPGNISYGSHGIGGSVHLATEELTSSQGVKMNHVPFKGSADMLTAMLGGHLNVAVDSTGAVPHVAAGKARVLAVLTDKRAAVWPEVPTLTELGSPIVSTSPYGIGTAAGTPPAVVKALHDAFKKGLEDPIHMKTLEKYNQPAWYLSSEDYTKWARAQYEKERKIITSLGLGKK